ncbi:DNA polymerase III subunit alpha [Arenibacter sp. BSSL-BM3]|uniref:DNA-directed DNA polymerase n=1 Tax=Arenibacter arenosicollis TaxID=2762274 RepID=A0ABR7QRR5_9FLAO|nr:DNA polymerase III subunit alpha [Arenibacter arenosicollis]MBC8769853.1 DNA polymerase III subunit alpha [Arenibacter arenosicollis]
MFLNCHSYHSLRYGTIPLEELVDLAAQMGVVTLGLTDINTVTGIYDFIRMCDAKKIKPIVGVEFRNNDEKQYTGLAKNTKGIGELCEFLTNYNLNEKQLPTIAPKFKNAFIIYPLSNVPVSLEKNEFLGVNGFETTKLIKPIYQKLLRKTIAFQSVTIRNEDEYELHKTLRCIDHNILLSQLPEDAHCHPSEVMDPTQTLEKQFSRYSGIIRNAEKLADRCNFTFDFTVPRNKKLYTGSKSGDMLLLGQLAEDGIVRRYGAKNKDAKVRMEKELKVIGELNFTGYFLITWDIIRYSQSRGFMHVGRGSGANSIVSYALGITDICPIELDLYFERFLNQNRKSPPDFDIDWSWQERDEILDYIFKRFSPGHVAFCGTIVEFKHRSIMRELGKVYGLQKAELDQLSNKGLQSGGTDSVVDRVAKLGAMLLGFPNQRSMHACGVIISEEPITNFSALEIKPKGFPIVQFDMHIAEDIGFEKFDILSQRGLGTIASTVELVKENKGISIAIEQVNSYKVDVQCNSNLQIGNTLGCFYIESPAMRGLLRRLKCNDYQTLVAASSIIRPGVAKSGMMKEYIYRHNNPNSFEYFHEVFEEFLGDTYGIMVYQEDVIKIALHYGGLEPTYGDILRRAISGKSRSKKEIESLKYKFFESCKIRGHDEQLSLEVFRQIESFAGYSFCKAHSASYAVESYQSLYLKTYYGIEFMVCAINNGGGFYRTEIYVHEAKRSGGTVHVPCVNNSELQTCVKGVDIYLGFGLIKSMDEKLAVQLVEERKANGDFTSLENFLSRTAIGGETLQTLIFVGAFRFTGKPKSDLIIIAKMLESGEVSKSPMLLIEEPIQEYTFPVMERNIIEDAFDEIEILGFSVSLSPFELLKTKYRGDVMNNQLLDNYKKTVRMLAYLVSTKQVPTKNGNMYFGTWIDNNGDYFDTAHFATTLTKYPFKGGGCYLLLGTVEVDFHFPTIIISKMEKMPFVPDPRYENGSDRDYKVHERLKEDRSTTHRAPYPQEHEIGLPRSRMN